MTAAATESFLVQRAKQEDEEAFRELMRRYRGVIGHECSMFYFDGQDPEDVYQEALIGLHKAVQGYDPQKNPSFKLFLSMVIRRQLIAKLEQSQRFKHQILTNADSLQRPLWVEGDLGEIPLGDTLAGWNGVEQLAEQRAMLREVFRRGSEMRGNAGRIFPYWVVGMSSKEAAEALSWPTKRADNAFSRLKRNFADVLAASAS